MKLCFLQKRDTRDLYRIRPHGFILMRAGVARQISRQFGAIAFFETMTASCIEIVCRL